MEKNWKEDLPNKKTMLIGVILGLLIVLFALALFSVLFIEIMGLID